MKQIRILLLTLVVASCSPRLGINGHDGKNGHSMVSEYNTPSGMECSNGGSRLDVYLDMDDSLTVSSNDTYQGSLVACNGMNGLAGAQGTTGAQGDTGLTGSNGSVGPQGPAGVGLPGPMGETGPMGLTGAQGASGSGATITSYTLSVCTSLGMGLFGKSNTNTYSVYTMSSCASSSKVEDMNDSKSTLWFTSKILGVFSSPNGLRVITYN